VFDFDLPLGLDLEELAGLAGEILVGVDGDLGRFSRLLIGAESQRVEWALLEREDEQSLLIPVDVVGVDGGRYVADLPRATATALFATPHWAGAGLAHHAVTLSRQLPDLIPAVVLPSPNERYQVVDLFPRESVGEGLERGTDAAGPSPVDSEKRSLVATAPASVCLGTRFAAQVKVVVGGDGEPLRIMDPIPSAGLPLMITVDVPESFQVVGPSAVDVILMPFGDSAPVAFSFIPSRMGRFDIAFSAWIGGSHIGGVTASVLVAEAELGRTKVKGVMAHTTVADPGELSLKITRRNDGYSFDLYQQTTGFQIDERSEPLQGNVAHLVEDLVKELDDYARARSRSPDELIRERLKARGFDLWEQLVPPGIKAGLLMRRGTTTQLTIFANDLVPWELLYAQDDEGSEYGFLVEMFSLSRWVTGGASWSPALSLTDLAFVVPDDSPEQAMAEVRGIWTLLGREDGRVLQDKKKLLDTLLAPDFDSLHFACHNYFTDGQGSQIRFVDGPFEPVDLGRRQKMKPLLDRGTLVFLNACRTTGASTSYTKLQDWAQAFIGLGAAAVIGTAWAVRDTTAQLFADEVYKGLLEGHTLGSAVQQARTVAGAVAGDSSWLAYTVYGNPKATVRKQES
jgi:hypothetical protein